MQRQRSNTTSSYLESVRLTSQYNSHASVYRYDPRDDGKNEEGAATEQERRESVDERKEEPGEEGSGALTHISSSDQVPTAADRGGGPLGAIGGLSRGEGEMSAKEAARWTRMACGGERQENEREEKGKETEKETTAAAPGETSGSDSDSEEKRQRAVVLYDFVGQTEEELDVAAGDVVTVWERSNGEWWFGSVNGREFGFFPKVYVHPLLPDDGHH
jgi:hypothetical protein